eukprot:bmy_04820T0
MRPHDCCRRRFRQQPGSPSSYPEALLGQRRLPGCSGRSGDHRDERLRRTSGPGEEDDDDDYENTAPLYKDLPPKPGKRNSQRPGKKTESPPLPCKLPKNTGEHLGLNLTPVTCTTPQLDTDLVHPPSQLPITKTPVPWISQKSGGPRCYQEERLMVYVCLLVVVSLLMGCTGLAVTLIKYQEVVEELRMLTFQQMAWRANVTGMAGLAGLKKDIDRGKCYYFSPSTKSWDEARKFCQENYSHLVIISNFAEQNFVAKAHGSPRVYWLGLNDRNREGDWRWLDGSPITLRQVSRALGISLPCQERQSHIFTHTDNGTDGAEESPDEFLVQVEPAAGKNGKRDTKRDQRKHMKWI